MNQPSAQFQVGGQVDAPRGHRRGFALERPSVESARTAPATSGAPERKAERPLRFDEAKLEKIRSATTRVVRGSTRA